jgi:hypothetical protein
MIARVGHHVVAVNWTKGGVRKEGYRESQLPMHRIAARASSASGSKEEQIGSVQQAHGTILNGEKPDSHPKRCFIA